MNTVNTNKVYCVIMDNVIEVNDKTLGKVRGINPAIFSLSHPVYEVSKKGWSFLRKNGFTEVSQFEYCKLHNLPCFRDEVGEVIRRT